MGCFIKKCVLVSGKNIRLFWKKIYLVKVVEEELLKKNVIENYYEAVQILKQLSRDSDQHPLNTNFGWY